MRACRNAGLAGAAGCAAGAEFSDTLSAYKALREGSDARGIDLPGSGDFGGGRFGGDSVGGD